MPLESRTGRRSSSDSTERFDAIETSKAFRSLPETEYHYLSARLFCIEELSVRNSWVIRRHEHNSFELVVCRRGTYSCIVNKQRIAVGKNQALLIKPGDLHEDITRKKCDLVFVKFYIVGASDTEERLLIFTPDAPVSRFVFTCTAPMANQVDEILAIAGNKDLLSSLMQDALCLTLFWRVCMQLPSEVFRPKFLSTLAADTLATRLSMLYAKSIDRRLSVRDMARELAMSVSALERMCKKEMGISPAQAWGTLRMHEAMRIVRHSKLSIKEISEKLAFSHQNHFTNAFTRHFRKPPSYFRTHGYPGLLHDEDQPAGSRAR